MPSTRPLSVRLTATLAAIALALAGCTDPTAAGSGQTGDILVVATSGEPDTLNPVLGYEKSAAIAKEALATNGSVYDLVLQKGWLTREALDDILKPENMTAPRQLP